MWRRILVYGFGALIAAEAAIAASTTIPYVNPQTLAIPATGVDFNNLIKQINVSVAAATGMFNLCSTNIQLGNSYFTITGCTFGWSLGLDSVQAGTTYTLQSSDCGTEVDFTNASGVTVTIPNSLSVGCLIPMAQLGAGKVTLSGTGGTQATLQSPHGYTGTFAQYSTIGIKIVTNNGGSSAVALFLGDGS